MADDIVTRQETEIDFVEYLRLWASPDANNQAVKDLHKAADEIERLRKLMSDYVSLWYQVETGRSLDGVFDPENVVKAYHAKFHEMKEEADRG